jgi:hypothetical protein
MDEELQDGPSAAAAAAVKAGLDPLGAGLL